MVGTFIACMNALQQLKIEGGVDIFQIVRRLKISKAQFVESTVSSVVNLFSPVMEKKTLLYIDINYSNL